MLTMLLVGVLLLLLLAAVQAPFESLGWYAGWYKTDEVPDVTRLIDNEQKDVEPASPQADLYLVYLSGIGAMSGLSIPDEEFPFLERLAARTPQAVLTHDVFPYSVTNTGLTVHRAFARLWRYIEERRISHPSGLLPYLINIRNLFQVLVSADKRYGPVMNYGVSVEILRSLRQSGYDLRQRRPIALLGSSGGGQIAVGAALFVRHMTAAPVSVISIGGVIASDPGLDALEHLYHLYGDKDRVHSLADIAFPGRWPRAINSSWSRAVAEGRVTRRSLGPLAHNLKEHYFDDNARTPAGTTYLNLTIEAIGQIADTMVGAPAAAGSRGTPAATPTAVAGK